MTLDTPRRLAFMTAAACVIVLALTSPGIPLVWDETDYLSRADQVISWFRLLADGADPQGGLHAFSESTVRDHWPFITTADGHPAWAVVPVAATKALLTGTIHPLTAARLGTVAVFSAACGVIAFRLRKEYGAVAAVGAVVALLTFPRIFSEAHFATLDGPLAAWWLMLWAADASIRADVGSTIGTGVLAGLTAATKFTGWLAWTPVIAWRVLRGDGRQRVALLLILPIGLLTFCAVNPPLWHHPLDGLLTHFGRSLGRAQSFNIGIEFLGRVYDMRNPLPWYNTIAWLVLVTPLPLLVLGGIGLMHCLRTRDAISLSLLFHWATLMVVRALPFGPPHDGIRLVLPAFAFWCVFAGIGAQRMWERSRRPAPGRGPAPIGGPAPAWRGLPPNGGLSSNGGLLVRTAIVIALAADAITVARYFPQTLSHYSLLVGGVRGAARMGMEPTYWWDALDNDVLTWINNNTAAGEAVAFSPTFDLFLLRQWGRLRPPRADPHRDAFRWYVLQNRTGFLDGTDRVLIGTVKPSYTKFAGRHPAGTEVPPDLNVPLLLIFTGDEYRAAAAGRHP